MKIFEQKIIVPRRMRWVEDASPDIGAIDGSREVSFIGTAVSESRIIIFACIGLCLLYTSPSPRDGLLSRMPSSA